MFKINVITVDTESVDRASISAQHPQIGHAGRQADRTTRARAPLENFPAATQPVLPASRARARNS